MTTANVQQEVSSDDVSELLSSARLLRARAVAEVSASPARDALEKMAERLQASVIRPLAMLLGEAEEPPHPESDTPQIGTPDMVLWDLARQTTSLCAAAGRPAALMEAAAALQDLSCQSDAAESAARAAKLRDLLDQMAPSIRTEAKGPLLVTNVPDIRDWLGQPLPARPLTALCRCGASAMKPYCDGSHARRFEDAKIPPASKTVATHTSASRSPFSTIAEPASTQDSVRTGFRTCSG